MEERNTIKEFLTEVATGASNVLHVAEKVLSDGQKEVTVELRKERHLPKRMESQPRAHVFHNVNGFCEYLKAHKKSNSLVCADLEQGTIQGVLGDAAENGREIITLQPVRDPAFKLLSKMLNTQLRVTDFAALAKRNRRVLGETEEDGRDFAMLMQQITISSSIKAYQGTGKKSTNGLICESSVKAGITGTPTEIELPDCIGANVPLYVQRPVRYFDIDLTVTVMSNEALIHADAPELEVLQYNELCEILTEIKDQVGSEVLTTAGQLRYGQWRYQN